MCHRRRSVPPKRNSHVIYRRETFFFFITTKPEHLKTFLISKRQRTRFENSSFSTAFFFCFRVKHMSKWTAHSIQNYMCGPREATRRLTKPYTGPALKNSYVNRVICKHSSPRTNTIASVLYLYTNPFVKKTTFLRL